MNLVLLHGFRANPELPHWFPWIAARAREKGINVMVPQLPNSHHPIAGEWISALRELVPLEDFPNTIFIGHSLGGATIVRMLERINAVAAHCYLVAAPHDMVGRPAIQNFFETPFDIPTIRAHSKKWTCVYSKDDPYVPYEHGERYAKELGAEMLSFDSRSHFEQQDTFPELLTHLLTSYEERT